MRAGLPQNGVPARGASASPAAGRPGGEQAHPESSSLEGAPVDGAGMTLVHLAHGTLLLHALALGAQDLLLLEQSWEEALHTMAVPRTRHKFGT